jgi:hypothetical protein
MVKHEELPRLLDGSRHRPVFAGPGRRAGAAESLPKPLAPDSFGFAANITGDLAGRFAVMLDATVLDYAAGGRGDGPEGRLGGAAARGGRVGLWASCWRARARSAALRVRGHDREAKVSRAFQLKSGDKAWTILVRDEVRAPQAAKAEPGKAEPGRTDSDQARYGQGKPPPNPPGWAAGSQRRESSCCSMSSSTPRCALAAGRCRWARFSTSAPATWCSSTAISPIPVDLIVGDKIVARGEVVLINGNFGLRVTEVAAPRKRLESIRCLF